MKRLVCVVSVMAIAVVLLLALFVATPPFAPADQRDEAEPPAEVVRSGSCVVDVCTGVDMGDYTFVLYSRGLPYALEYIPKGSCRCNVIQPTKRLRNYIRIDPRVSDGRRMQHVSVLTFGPRQHQPITFDEFEKRKFGFIEVSDFHPDGDALSAYRVYRSREFVGATLYNYFLVPLQQTFLFKGQAQPVAFEVPNGVYVGPPLKTPRPEPTLAAAVSLYGDIRFFQFFYPRLMSSDQWVEALKLSAEAIDTRLFPKR